MDDSKPIAEKRLMQVTKKLCMKRDDLQAYDKPMREYFEREVAENVKETVG